MHHLELAGGEALALAFGVLGELKLELDAVAGEKALLDADKERQRPRRRKGVDPDQRLVGPGAGGKDQEGSRKAQDFHVELARGWRRAPFQDMTVGGCPLVWTA